MRHVLSRWMSKKRSSAELKPFRVGVLANMDYVEWIDRFLSILPSRLIVLYQRGTLGLVQVKGPSFTNFFQIMFLIGFLSYRTVRQSPGLPFGHRSSFQLCPRRPFLLSLICRRCLEKFQAGIEDSHHLDELEEMGYATTCRFTASDITEMLMDFIEGERVFPDKPFIWSTERCAPKVIEIANRFLNRSF